MTKHTVKEINKALSSNRDTYKELYSELSQEQQLAKAEADAARQTLETVLAGFVYRAVPDLKDPAISTFDNILREHGQPNRPVAVKEKLQAEHAQATDDLIELTQKYGTYADLKQTQDERSARLGSYQDARTLLRDEQRITEKELREFNKMNNNLEAHNYGTISAATLTHYARPATLLNRALRWATDGAYRIARPVLDLYETEGVDLHEKLELRDSQKAALATNESSSQKLIAEQTLAGQTLQKFEETSGRLHSNSEILAAVRTTITDALMDKAIFESVKQAFPGQLPPEADALHLRAALFGKVADNIIRHKSEVDGIIDQLDDPIAKLSKAERNRRGSKEIEFDLDGKSSGMARHQLLMSQRVRAARDIRSAARSPEVTSRYASSNDSNDWLLWYLIMQNNNTNAALLLSDTAHHTAGFLSGGGGEYGGGGAGGSWPEPATNSFFRAEMLGITPQNASGIGLDGSLLRIEPSVMQDLGLGSKLDMPTSSDFNQLSGADLSGANLNLGSGFNDLSKGMQFDTGSMDLERMTRDLGSISTDLGSSLSDISSSSSSYDSGGYSSSSSSSYDSGSSSSYDSGSSSSSSSCSFD